MLPKNFPGRVNDRRKAALARLPQGPGSGERKRNRHVRMTAEQRAAERAVLKCRILPDSIARGQRSKKDHRSRAKLGRNA